MYVWICIRPAIEDESHDDVATGIQRQVYASDRKGMLEQVRYTLATIGAQIDGEPAFNDNEVFALLNRTGVQSLDYTFTGLELALYPCSSNGTNLHTYSERSESPQVD